MELILPRHARCVFFRLCCNGHSPALSSYLSRIGRIENPSCSACGHSSRTLLISFRIVQLQTLCVARSLETLCVARSLETLCLSTISGPDPEEFPCFWASMVFRHAPSLGRGRVAATTTRQSFFAFATCMYNSMKQRHEMSCLKLLDASSRLRPHGPSRDEAQVKYIRSASNLRLS